MKINKVDYGHRAIMYSTTTDPYQVIRNSNPKIQKTLNEYQRATIRRSLEMIRDESNLNVRILTRSPLSRLDFDIYKTFSNRLLFGMSLPTLNQKILSNYEPNAPHASSRLSTLKEAAKRGIPLYVAMAPTFPECNKADLKQTMEAIRALNPITVFHEPINVRGPNEIRIFEAAKIARKSGFEVNLDIWDPKKTSEERALKWADYAMEQMTMVEQIANDLSMSDVLHLWPDSRLSTKKISNHLKIKYPNHREWILKWHQLKSNWPS